MKYILPLMLVSAAVWAATREPRDVAHAAPSTEPARSEHAPQLDPWLIGALDEAGVYAEDQDPHAGLYGDDDASNLGILYGDDDDPHAGLYGDDDESNVGMCPRDDADDGVEVLAAGDMDPHLHARLVTPGVELPQGGVRHSAASNGRSIAELHAERGALADQTVRVRGMVVKLTDGILGETYLHLRDGSGSAEQRDDDLTVTTTDEFELGETVELEGRVLIDQDLGLGYRYDALLTGATRIAAR